MLEKSRGFLLEMPFNFLLARLSVNSLPGVEEFLPASGTCHVATPHKGKPVVPVKCRHAEIPAYLTEIHCPPHDLSTENSYAQFR